MSAHADIAVKIDTKIPSRSDRMHICALRRQLEQVLMESDTDDEQTNTRVILSSHDSTVNDRLSSMMTLHRGSQIHGFAAHQSRKDDIPQESACHQRMHEAEGHALSQAAAVVEAFADIT